MSKRILNVAIVNWTILKQSQQDILDRAGALTRKAKEAGADAIGFVEYFSILGTGISSKAAAEIPGEGPVTAWAIALSKEHDIEIWCPFIEEGKKGDAYNAVAIIDPEDGIVGNFQEFHFFELRTQGLEIGEAIQVIDRPWGKLGCFICYDIHFSEISRALSLQGAELVFWPTLTDGPYSIDHVRRKAQVRCMDHGFWMIEANRNLSTIENYPDIPSACIYNPEGEICHQVSQERELVIAPIDLSFRSKDIPSVEYSDFKNVDEATRYKRSLRPEYYADLFSSLPADKFER